MVFGKEMISQLANFIFKRNTPQLSAAGISAYVFNLQVWIELNRVPFSCGGALDAPQLAAGCAAAVSLNRPRESHIIYCHNALRHTSRHIQVYIVFVVVNSVAVCIKESDLCSITLPKEAC